VGETVVDRFTADTAAKTGESERADFLEPCEPGRRVDPLAELVRPVAERAALDALGIGHSQDQLPADGVGWSSLRETRWNTRFPAHGFDQRRTGVLEPVAERLEAREDRR